MKTHKADGKPVSEEEYTEYRRKYRANWEKQKYEKNPEHREQKLERKRNSYKNLDPEKKRKLLDNISDKRKAKLKDMTESEKKAHYEEKREYAKARRDKTIASTQRKKYESMDDSGQEKFLDKLIRYNKLIDEFKEEITARESQD